MKYQLILKNMEYLEPRSAAYGAMLVEKQPDVEFLYPSQIKPVESYLWYPIELGQIPETYGAYLQEKLAVTDPVEAQLIIND